MSLSADDEIRPRQGTGAAPRRGGLVRTDDPDREMAHLLDVETGNAAELWVRYLGIGLGAVLLYAYTGQAAALGWGVLFLAVHRGFVLFMQSRLGRTRRRDLLVAAALFALLLGIFMSAPTLMILSGDDALRFCGATMAGSMLVFLVRRSDRLEICIWAQVAVVGSCIALASAVIALRLPGALPTIGVLLCGGVLVFYLAQASYITRAQRLAAERRASFLAQEQKMAAIGQLAGGVAHDFNNILTAITGNLELSREVGPDEREHCLAEAEADADRAAVLVRQLLVYARKSTPAARPADAAEVMQRTVDLTGRLVPARVRREVFVPRFEVPVRADTDLLMTALINLVNNAVDAMPGGGVLTMRARTAAHPQEIALADGRRLAAGRYAALSVEDTGPGIPPADLPKVLEPFFTTKAVGKGSGLGLSMVAGFAEAAGGGLSIDSAPGRTVLTILLPLREAAVPKPVPGGEET